MKLLNLNIQVDGEPGAITKSVELIKDIVSSFIMTDKKDQEANRRKYYKISDALENMLKEGKTEIELEDDWFGLIRQAKKDLPGINPKSSLVRKVEEAIDAVPNR